MSKASDLVKEATEAGKSSNEIVAGLAELMGDHRFTVQELVSAQTEAIMGGLQTLGIIITNLYEAALGGSPQGDLGNGLVDSFRIVMALALAETVEDAEGEAIVAEVIEEG